MRRKDCIKIMTSLVTKKSRDMVYKVDRKRLKCVTILFCTFTVLNRIFLCFIRKFIYFLQKIVYLVDYLLISR